MMKRKDFIIRYTPCKKEYSPQQIRQFYDKEEALITYVLEQLLSGQATKNKGAFAFTDHRSLL